MLGCLVWRRETKRPCFSWMYVVQGLLAINNTNGNRIRGEIDLGGYLADFDSYRHERNVRHVCARNA